MIFEENAKLTETPSIPMSIKGARSDRVCETRKNSKRKITFEEKQERMVRKRLARVKYKIDHKAKKLSDNYKKTQVHTTQLITTTNNTKVNLVIKKNNTVELKKTERLPIIIHPIFRYIRPCK